MSDLKNKKIYLAGHTGMVGSAILRELKTRGYNNIITKDLSELDLRNQSTVQNFFEKTKPELAKIIAAAKVGQYLLTILTAQSFYMII